MIDPGRPFFSSDGPSPGVVTRSVGDLGYVEPATLGPPHTDQSILCDNGSRPYRQHGPPLAI